MIAVLCRYGNQQWDTLMKMSIDELGYLFDHVTRLVKAENDATRAPAT